MFDKETEYYSTLVRNFKLMTLNEGVLKYFEQVAPDSEGVRMYKTLLCYQPAIKFYSGLSGNRFDVNFSTAMLLSGIGLSTAEMLAANMKTPELLLTCVEDSIKVAFFVMNVGVNDSTIRLMLGCISNTIHICVEKACRDYDDFYNQLENRVKSHFE